jgi:hypothetical protein
MIARLQSASTSGRPILPRVDFDEGHGFGSSRPQRERLLADQFSFVLWQSGDAEFQPEKASRRALTRARSRCCWDYAWIAGSWEVDSVDVIMPLDELAVRRQEKEDVPKADR